MARGLPAVWSAVFAVPFLVAGSYLAGFQSRYPLFGSQPRVPSVVGFLLVGFGLFVLGLGLYVHVVVAPEAPRMRENESVVDQRDPAQRNALAETGVSVPVLCVGGYLLYFTPRPLVYPTVVIAAGLYLFSRGVHRYWRNTLTTYFLTTQRVIEEYRFISLVRNEVPHEKVRGVEERRSAWDSLFGLGDVSVRSGASGELTVSVDDVYDPTEFADRVRTELRSVQGSAPPGDGERHPQRAAAPGTQRANDTGPSGVATAADDASEEGSSGAESAPVTETPRDSTDDAHEGDPDGSVDARKN